MAERRFYQGETFANYDPGELLENAEFEDCVFDHCRWLGTRVQNCRFNACTFDHCNFSGVVFSFTTMKAIPHNSKCRYGERGAAAAKPKAQIILCVLSSILATQMPCRSRRSGA